MSCSTRLVSPPTALRSRSRLSRVRQRASSVAVPRAAGSVSEAFEVARQEGRTAFVPFLCAGDPDFEATRQALLALDEAGSTVIELGVPYSDPLADGSTIQAAASRALAGGATLDKCLELVEEMAPRLKAPLVLFTYFNPIMSRGLDTFAARLAEVGAKGLLVPDIPLEETSLVRESTSKHGIELVLLATPTTPAERMERIAAASEGFVYLVSLTGVTGAKTETDSRVEGLVSTLKSLTDKPVCVGFGISGPKQAKQVADWGADGVIMGSTLVKLLGEAESTEEGVNAVRDVATSVVEVLR